MNERIAEGENGHTMCRRCFLSDIGFVEWDKFYQSFVVLMSANKDSCKEFRKEFVEKKRREEEAQKRRKEEEYQKRHEEARKQWEDSCDSEDEDWKGKSYGNTYDRSEKEGDEAHYMAPEITHEKMSLIRQYIKEFGFTTISEVKTVADVTKAFRKVSIKHHPDRGGNGDLFKTLSSVRDYMIQILGGGK